MLENPGQTDVLSEEPNNNQEKRTMLDCLDQMEEQNILRSLYIILSSTGRLSTWKLLTTSTLKFLGIANEYFSSALKNALLNYICACI